MGDNNSDMIDSKAVTEVNLLFLKPNRQIAPHIVSYDNTPLLDGYVRVYKNNDKINDNYIDNIKVQVKGQTQKDSDFKEKITYGIDKNLLRIANRNLGLLFFVVRMEASSFNPFQVYYTLLTFDKTSALLKEIKEQKEKSIPLIKFHTLENFMQECLKYIDDKDILISQLNEKNSETINKYIASIDPKLLENPWLKSIYYNGEKICGKHPLAAIYDRLIKDINAIILVGEPRLGKSYEMLALYLSLNKDVITRFYDLSQYQGGNLENDLILDNEYLPYKIILDGYDEISPFHIRKFNLELRRIAEKYCESIFVISTREKCKNSIPHIDRKTGKNTEIYLTQITINDLLTSDDESEEKSKILSLESDQLKELFLIPIYRPIINEYKKDISIYDTLINYAIKQNRAKISTKYGDRALISDDELIEEFTLISLKMQSSHVYFVERTEQDNLLFETDFLKTYDGRFYSFSNKTYQDYFIALDYSKKSLEEITSFFFIKEKLKVEVIDIFIILFDLIKYNNKSFHNELYNKLESISIEALLITDLSLIPDDSRYDYFIRILENRNKNKNYIYYARSRPEFGPLKNVPNMAKKMQELLPASRRKDAFNVLIKNITEYLRDSNADTIISFANSIFLLNKYSDIIWGKDDLEALKNLSIEVIKFFLYNETAKPIKDLLTYHSIIIWYRDYSWTEKWGIDEWERFFNNVLNENKTLSSVISSDIEFAVKLAVFNSFYESKEIQSILKPILVYSIEKNKKVSEGKMDIIPSEVSDKDVYPVMHIDHYLWVFYELLIKLDVSLGVILETLASSIKNSQSKHDFFGIHNPISILENKLYDKIGQLTTEQYPVFSEYFLHKETLLDMHRFFEAAKSESFDNLRIYLLKKIYSGKIKISRWILESLLAKLLNLFDINKAKEQFDTINNIYNTEDNKVIYKGIIDEINLDTRHILHNIEKTRNDYQALFAKHIEAEKEHNERKIKIKDNIDKMLNNELHLMFDNDALSGELSKTIDYLNNPDNLNEDNTFIGKIRSLEPEHILNNIEHFFENEYKAPPIFSKTALFILKFFLGVNYTENNINIANVLLLMRKWQSEPFYIYFFWIYIGQYVGELRRQLFDQIIENEELKTKILDSMNNDIPKKFSNQVISDFDGAKSVHWVSPFLYTIKYLMSNTIPEYIKKEDALKLIACSNPYGENAMMSYNVNLIWFEDTFGTMISRSEIAKYGLENIDMLQDSLARLQIFNYLLDYYDTMNDTDLNICIKEYIIKKTKEMFSEEGKDASSSEYSPISIFWSKCEENHVDALFPHFTIDIVLSTTWINDRDINCQYRKTIIEYCIQVSTESQKRKIIDEINSDPLFKYLSPDQSFAINQFLASLGDEKNILCIIDGYLSGNNITITPYDMFTMYGFGCLRKTTALLNKYIDLLFYSTNIPDEQRYIRREKLFSLARNGIEQNISTDNFEVFENRMNTHINNLRQENKYTDFYDDFLLQIEQYVYSKE